MIATTLLSISALAAAVSAQNANITYATGLLAALTSNNLGDLANASKSLAATPLGLSLFAQLGSGKHTLLAPQNGAWSSFTSALANTTYAAELLSYHVLAGQYDLNSFAKSPNHTITRSFLNSSDYVTLEGGQPQVVVFAYDNATLRVRNQLSPAAVSNNFTYENLVILTINTVLEVPRNFSQMATQYNVTSFTSGAMAAGLGDELDHARGMTVFAPVNTAFTKAAASLQGLSQAQMASVLQNHIINGTTAYSPLLTSGKFTSAGGQTFSVVSNATGMFVASGNATAQVIQSDILLENGVLHLIDNVLVNQATNTQAAQSAYSSYTAAAATAAVATNTVGSTNTGSSSSSTTTTAKNSASPQWNFASAPVLAAVAGIVAGTALLA